MALHIKSVLPFCCRISALAGTVILLMGGCAKDGKKDIRDFYFPLKALQEGLVYEYQPVGNESLTPVYWYYRSFVQPEGVFLTGTYYEYELKPLQLVKEEWVENGMLLNDLLIYADDSLGQQRTIKAEILSGNVFPFEVTDSNGVFLYKVRLAFPEAPGITTTLIKNRRYLGEVNYPLEGKLREAVRFRVDELVEDNDPDDGVVEPAIKGEEIYAKDIGLVYFEKEISPDLTIAYQLVRRYPMTELEDLFLERKQEDER